MNIQPVSRQGFHQPLRQQKITASAAAMPTFASSKAKKAGLLSTAAAALGLMTGVSAQAGNQPTDRFSSHISTSLPRDTVQLNPAQWHIAVRNSLIRSEHQTVAGLVELAEHYQKSATEILQQANLLTNPDAIEQTSKLQTLIIEAQAAHSLMETCGLTPAKIRETKPEQPPTSEQVAAVHKYIGFSQTAMGLAYRILQAEAPESPEDLPKPIQIAWSNYHSRFQEIVATKVMPADKETVELLERHQVRFPDVWQLVTPGKIFASE